MLKTKNALREKRVDESEEGSQICAGRTESGDQQVEVSVEVGSPSKLGESRREIPKKRNGKSRIKSSGGVDELDLNEVIGAEDKQDLGEKDSRPPSKPKTKKSKTRKRGKKRRKRCYYPGWKDLESAEVQEGIRDFRYFKGVLRKNPRNLGETAFVTTEDPKATTDIFIPSLRYQNRALHLSHVLVELFDATHWRDILPGRTKALINEVDFLSNQTQNLGVDLIARAHTSSEVSCCSPSSSSQALAPGEDRPNPVCDLRDNWKTPGESCFTWNNDEPENEELQLAGDDESNPISHSPDRWKKPEEIDCSWNTHQLIHDMPKETPIEESVPCEEETPMLNDIQGLTWTNYSCEDDLSGINADNEQIMLEQENIGRRRSPQLEQHLGQSSYGPAIDAIVHPFDLKGKQPVGKIVAVWEGNNIDPERIAESKKHIGYIKRWRDRKLKNWFKFVPLDPTVPIAFLARGDKTQDFAKLSKKQRKYLYFEVRYLQWQKYESLPCCEFIRIAGKRGNLDTETSALLHQNNITHTAEFSEKIKQEMEQLAKGFFIEEEIDKRRDCRGLNVFSIDPANAKDLDDALSIEELENGYFRIGIHIADVTHFVKLSSETDKEARFRGTTVYLVQKTIPMLPKILCETLCSLNEGEGRLAYSVFVIIDASGRLVDGVDSIQFEKTVIENKCRMDYLQAQKILDDDFKLEELPESIKCDEVLRTAIVRDVKLCWRLAAKMRENRFENGALTLHRAKINVKISENNDPIGFQKYPIYNSNYLVEEFMLLANTLVAQKLTQDEEYSEVALLRMHPPPIDSIAQHQLALFRAKGWKIDISSAGAIESSLRKLETKKVGNVTARQAVETLLIKSFRLAAYFVVGKNRDPEKERHFALNLEAYTHFTSPIRRYADCVVHRQLTQILNGCRNTSDIHEISQTAMRCNERKLAAKNASERSQMVYFTKLLKQNPIIERAMIIDISHQRIIFVIHKLGIEDSVELIDRGMLLHGVSCEVFGEPPFSSIQLY